MSDRRGLTHKHCRIKNSCIFLVHFLNCSHLYRWITNLSELEYKMILLLILLLLHILSAQHLPLCSIQGDTFGEWKAVKDIKQSPHELREFHRHFIGGGPGESMEFSNVWIPRNCSMHRFTNASIYECVDSCGCKIYAS